MLMVVFRRVAGLLFSVANLAEKIGAFGCCFGFRWWRSNGEREVKGCVGHEVFRKQEAAAKRGSFFWWFPGGLGVVRVVRFRR